MSALPWLRLYTEIIDDEKLGLLAFEDRWHYIALLCLKGKGVLDGEPDKTLLDRKVALKLGLTLTELEKAVSRLASVRLIDKETYQPLSWDVRQKQSDTDPTAAQRKARQRQRERDMSRVTTVTVTRTEEDTDKEEETPKQPAANPPDGFDVFWKTYPKKTAKPAAVKAFRAAKLNGNLPNVLAHIQTMAASEAWTKSGGQFVPNPATYLNQRRWEDEHGSTSEPSGVGRFV